jgi:hypothetical protein
MNCKNNFIDADNILFTTNILNKNSSILNQDRKFALCAYQFVLQYF